MSGMFCFRLLVPPHGGEIVAYCQIYRYAANGKHTSIFETIATRYMDKPIAPQAATIEYTVFDESIHTVDTSTRDRRLVGVLV